MTHETTPLKSSRWWGTHALTRSQTAGFEIGPLQITLENRPLEWILQWNRSGRAFQGEARFVFSESRSEITLAPALPDRSITTKFETPLRILPGDAARIYIMVPLWVRLETRTHVQPLIEIATWRLSDTWIGPMSSAGEAGYAGRVPAYVDHGLLPDRKDLAISSVTIRNHGSETFIIDRFNLPAPRLTLYFSENTGFWTETITIEHGSDSEMANVHFDRKAPKEAEAAKMVCAPRIGQSDSGNVVRAFGALFHQRGAGA